MLQTSPNGLFGNRMIIEKIKENRSTDATIIADERSRMIENEMIIGGTTIVGTDILAVTAMKTAEPTTVDLIASSGMIIEEEMTIEEIIDHTRKINNGAMSEEMIGKEMIDEGMTSAMTVETILGENMRTMIDDNKTKVIALSPPVINLLKTTALT